MEAGGTSFLPTTIRADPEGVNLLSITEFYYSARLRWTKQQHEF